MTDSGSESDIELNSALLKKPPKMPKSPSDDVIQNIKKTTIKMMIKDALIELKSRKGVSLYAIKKHLTEKYQVNTEKLNFLVKKSLKTGIEDGIFVQLKGVGASGSFKLANNKEKEKKPKKKKQEKGAKETKKEAIEKPKKNIEKPAETKTKQKATKKKNSEEVKPTKKKVEAKEVKVTKKTKEKEKKEEKLTKKTEETGKKSKNKMAKGMQTPVKKREAMMKRKSIGSIIRRPKMRPKHS